MSIIIMNKRSRITRPQAIKAKPLRRNRLERNRSRVDADDRSKLLWRSRGFAETYYVLSGTARWTAEGVTHERAPGSFILHPSNIVHVMETGGEPLIAAYTWTGDGETLSSFTNPAVP